MPEKNQGLRTGEDSKYIVVRRDGKPITGDVFVLEIDRDPFAYFALAAYASNLAAYPVFHQLKADLEAKLKRIHDNGLNCRLDCPSCGKKHVCFEYEAPKFKHYCAHCSHVWSPPFPFKTKGIEK